MCEVLNSSTKMKFSTKALALSVVCGIVVAVSADSGNSIQKDGAVFRGQFN